MDTRSEGTLFLFAIRGLPALTPSNHPNMATWHMGAAYILTIFPVCPKPLTSDIGNDDNMDYFPFAVRSEWQLLLLALLGIAATTLAIAPLYK